jgi:hypothetical protein
MNRFAINASIAALVFVTSFRAVAAGPGTPRVPTPVILSTSVDFDDRVIVITGKEFGKTEPKVRLANHVLTVRSFTDARVVANLPADIPPATYRLTVSTGGANQTTSNPFNTALFASK